ncbi:MAG: DUF2062 domain-containing protein [Pseudomonadota bacterium]
MIFKRREKRGFWSIVKDLLQPRKGWRRGFQYIGRRVQRLPDSPHRIALGFACGAFASFSPFFTLHALVAVILAYAIRGNIIAGVFGTVVGNPLSFPFIAATSMGLGNWILGRLGDAEAALSEKMTFSYLWAEPWDFFESIFTPYLIGGLLPGLLCGAAFYFALRPVVAAFQERRRRILSARARRLVAERRARARAPRRIAPGGQAI